jgi:hypothetical protein
MEIFISKQKYDFEQYHDFLVSPVPKAVYDIYVSGSGIKEFFILFFDHLNQFPLYITFEWYDHDFDEMKEELDKLGVVYTYKFIPQNSGYRLVEDGEEYFDILIFTVKVTNKNELIEIVKNSLIPYHLFVISNQNNLTFNGMYYKKDCLHFKINESTTFCKMQLDIPATYLVTNQFDSMEKLLAYLPKEVQVQIVEEEYE